MRFATIAGLAVAAAALAGSARADEIDRVMLHDAPAIAHKVHSLGKTVGVLQFQVKEGKHPATFRAGFLNTQMVNRLRNVLILGNESGDAMTVLGDAGPAAAARGKALKRPVDWASAAGRAELFHLEVPLAWDATKTAKADVFVTGLVEVAADYRTMTVKLYAFTSKNPEKLEPIGSIVGEGTSVAKARGVSVDRSTLAAMGQSFSVKSRAAAKTRTFLELDSEASKTAETDDKNGSGGGAVVPPASPDQPVTLTVLFNGTAVAPEPAAGSPGEGSISAKTVRSKIGNSPTEGTKVSFRLTNNSDEKLGVLLAVNGENTIAVDGDKIPDKAIDQCRLWVLAPKSTIDIPGFLKQPDKGGKAEYADFKVLPEDKSKELYQTMNSDHRGQIFMTVFGNREESVAISGGDSTGNEGKTDKTANTSAEVLDDPVQARGVKARALAEAIYLGGKPVGLAKTRSAANARSAVLANTHIEHKTGSPLTPSREAMARSIKARTRGIIIQGEQTVNGQAVKVEAFTYKPGPLYTQWIEYYTDGGSSSGPAGGSENLP